MTIDHSTGELSRQPAGNPAAMLLNGAGTMTAAGRAEMARGVAEVLAQVQVAQAIPRQIDRTIDRIRISCARYKFAEKAHYSYKRGGKTITGPSVKLIREIAAAFGNFQYGLVEVDRDEQRGFSMMMAYAWDVETNTRNSSTFMVRAVHDLKPEEEGGERRKVALFDERDIYENNTNMGARRVREAIKATVPAWLVDEASELCMATMERGPLDADGKATPLPIRMTNAVEKFASEFGVRKAQLEKFLEADFDEWRARDLARLMIVFQSLNIGDLRVRDVFPAQVSDADLAAQAAARGPAGDEHQAGEGGGEGGGEAAADPFGPLTDETKRQIETLFAVGGWASQGGDARRRAVAGWLGAQLPHGTVPSWETLTEGQGLAAKAALTAIMDGEQAGRREALDTAYAEARAAAKTAKAETAKEPAAGKTEAAPDPRETLNAQLAEHPGLGDDTPQSAARRIVVAGVLATGHYYELPGIGSLTPDEAATALANLAALKAKATSKGEFTGMIKRIHDDALAQRDQMQAAAQAQARQADDDPGPDDPAE
jgi:hypothetical protein